MPYSDRDGIGDQARVDPLFLAGGTALAFVAGSVNAISLGYFHVPISHMTGAVTRLSMDVASLNFSEFRDLSYIVIGFLLGAIFSGSVIGAGNHKPSMHYSVVMAVESGLLFTSFFLFKAEANSALFLAASACGMQNGMASSYLGLIVRTTHLTGIVTDLGVLIGQAMRHQKVKIWKLVFLSSILVGFFTGGLTGFLAYNGIGYYSIFIPASMCLVGAIGFHYLRERQSAPR